MTEHPDRLAERFEGIRRALAAVANDRPTPEQIAEWNTADKAMAQRIRAALPGVPLHHAYAVLQALRVTERLDAAYAPAASAVPAPAADQAAAPTDWIDGHPQLEAIAAAVWEQCRTEGTSLVVDDPRNIAVAALAAVVPAPADRADVYAEVADRLAADAEQGAKDGFTRIYRRSAAKQVREWGDELRRLADEAQQPETEAPPAPLRRSEDVCPGFPEQCPNLRSVDPDPPVHLGGIRCGCADQPADGAQQPKEARPPTAYSDGKGRTYCLPCAPTVGADVPLTINDVDHWELCPSCGRHVVDVARATEQPKEA